jgi:membrane-associated protein
LEDIIYLLAHYKYILLLPLAIVEGPVIAVIAGLLCTDGYLEPLPAYIIIVCGDITGDSLCYWLGRQGIPNFLKRSAVFLGLEEDKIKRARDLFTTNPIRAISLSKIVLGIGVAGIYMAGHTKIPYPKFLRICLATSMVQYVFYLGVGLLFGSAYRQINHYLSVFASITIILFVGVLFFLFIKSILKKI